MIKVGRVPRQPQEVEVVLSKYFAGVQEVAVARYRR